MKKLLFILPLLLILSGCSNDVGLIADCEDTYGIYRNDVEIVYQHNNLRNERDYYILSGGTQKYCPIEIETYHSPGVTNIVMSGCSIITGGENLAFQSSCIVKTPPKRRYKSIINNFERYME